MKKRSKRLQPLLELARQKSRQGIQAIVYMQHRLEEEEEKLLQLKRCQQDYKFKNTTEKQSVNAISLRSLREFKANVELAILQQSRQLQTVKGQLQTVREQWRQLDARSQSLEKTQEKFRQEECRILDKNEQQEQEEFTRQLSLTKPGISRH